MEGTHQYQYRQGGENICQTTCFSCHSAIFVGDDNVEKTDEGFGFMDSDDKLQHPRKRFTIVTT